MRYADNLYFETDQPWLINEIMDVVKTILHRVSITISNLIIYFVILTTMRQLFNCRLVLASNLFRIFGNIKIIAFHLY